MSPSTTTTSPNNNNKTNNNDDDDKAFYRAFGLVVATLSVGIVVLGLLVSTSGPRVRHVVEQSISANGGTPGGINQEGLSVVFDRPIESTTSDFQSTIEIEPKVEYTVSHRNQQLNISFEENLLSNTEYLLTVKPMLEDSLGQRMQSQYTYKFSTAEPSFTYLERNYGAGELDKVIERAALSQEEESYILYGAEKIKSFGRNEKHLAVVVPRADNTDELRVVDIATREERSVDLPRDVRVQDLKFSPVDNQFVFVARSVPTSDTEEVYSEASGEKLYRYDIDGDQLQPIVSLSEEGNIDSVLYSHDGQALLYRTLDREYYLIGAAQTTEPTLLGKYGDTGGFDRTNTKLTFLSGSDAMVYDAQAKQEREVRSIQIGGRISTPTFLHNSDELIYLREPIGVETLQVYTANADGELEEQVVDSRPPARFFDEPVVSYDDRYVLIEATFEPQGEDNYVGNSKPKDARLVLYDRFDGKVIDSGTIRGIDPIWNR
jgi:hypothetical protein